ncbi:MAG: aldolase/citrate lyase family protein [Prosthecobacter sp.]|nr:aldolase/citrate lyase family protein [Prosthecobacter sp.]
MTGEQIRQNLHTGGRVYGTHVCGLSHAVATKIIATAPLDFAFVCNEHMPVDRAETSMLCQHFDSLGISPIVRIPFPCAREAAMASDGGAHGIVAPYVETVEEVKEIVGAVHYRPIKGRQLRGILDGTQPPAEATREFLGRFNRHHYAIIGIESVAAYQNLDALISVPGVDGVFMGPHDLSVSLEAPEQWENPALLRLIEDVIVRCRAAGIGVGVHLSPVFSLEQTRRFVALGMNWILDGADVIFALNGLRQRRADLCGTTVAAPTGVASCIAAE